MFIYILRSSLFVGQQRTIISDFPIRKDNLENMVNFDNKYSSSDDRAWKLVQD